MKKKRPRSRQKTDLFIRDFCYIPKTPNHFHPGNFPKSIKIPIFVIFSPSTQYLRSNNQNRLINYLRTLSKKQKLQNLYKIFLFNSLVLVTNWLFDTYISLATFSLTLFITGVPFPKHCFKKTAHEVLFSQVSKIDTQRCVISRHRINH